MATINLPFAASATRRAPTSGELADGFPCGSLDIELFNWLAWYHTGQIGDAVEKSGLTQADNDTTQLARAVRSQKLNYIGTVGGTANALTVTLDPAIANYSEIVGTPFILVPQSDNTGAATVNFNGLGTKAIIRMDGEAVQPRDIVTGRPLPGLYDGTNFRVLGFLPSMGRTKLLADTTLYINSSTGSDANPGTLAAPFLTLQGAADYAQKNLDLNGFKLTFSTTGNFTAGVVVNGMLVGQRTVADVVFQMGTSNVTATNSSCFYAGEGAKFTTLGTGTLAATGTAEGQGCAIVAAGGGSTVRHNGFSMGACAVAHISANNLGVVVAAGNYIISGNAPYHLSALSYGRITIQGVNISLSGTRAFSSYFASSVGATIGASGASFTGTATGARYLVDLWGSIFTNGGGANFFPGNAAGTATATGDYR